MSDLIVRRASRNLLPVALTVAFSAFIVPMARQDGLAQAAPKFECQSIQGVPTTVARNKRGQLVPIIQWVSQAFAADGWTPERRCEVVTLRFNQFYESGQLKYITSGRMNGLPVVCVTPKLDAGCSGQLYTLKPYQDPAETVRKLIAINKSGGKAPVLRETSERPYLDLEQLIEQVVAIQQEKAKRQPGGQPQSLRHNGQIDSPDPQDPNASSPLF